MCKMRYVHLGSSDIAMEQGVVDVIWRQVSGTRLHMQNVLVSAPALDTYACITSTP